MRRAKNRIGNAKNRIRTENNSIGPADNRSEGAINAIRLATLSERSALNAVCTAHIGDWPPSRACRLPGLRASPNDRRAGPQRTPNRPVCSTAGPYGRANAVTRRVDGRQDVARRRDESPMWRSILSTRPRIPATHFRNRATDSNDRPTDASDRHTDSEVRHTDSDDRDTRSDDRDARSAAVAQVTSRVTTRARSHHPQRGR